MRWLKRIAKGVGAGLGLMLLALVFVGAYLRLDKEHVFYEARGTYRDVVTLESWESDRSSVRLLELRNERGDAVANAYFRRPFELDPDYRVVVTYAGAKTRKRILTLVPDRSDVVLVGMQYPYESRKGFLHHLRWPHDVRQAVFRTVAGGMLAVSFLQKEEKLNIERLVVVGVSVGGPFATMHGALDERVPTVVLIHAGGNLPAQILAAAKRRWLAGIAAALAAIFFDTFEPLHYIDRIAPRRLIMIAAREDMLLPVENVEELYANAGEPKEIIWTESGHVRSKDKNLITDIIGRLEQYLE